MDRNALLCGSFKISRSVFKSPQEELGNTVANTSKLGDLLPVERAKQFDGKECIKRKELWKAIIPIIKGATGSHYSKEEDYQTPVFQKKKEESFKKMAPPRIATLRQTSR